LPTLLPCQCSKTHEQVKLSSELILTASTSGHDFTEMTPPVLRSAYWWLVGTIRRAPQEQSF
jgi:hypothetical protein